MLPNLRFSRTSRNPLFAIGYLLFHSSLRREWIALFLQAGYIIVTLIADFLKEKSPFEWGGVYHLEAGEYRFHFKPGADPEMDFVLLLIAGWQRQRGGADT